MKLEDVILRSTRALQPAANTVPAGTIYYVTDENVLERSSGVVWQDISSAGSPVIPNDSITYAKLQNISATARVIGRKTAGAGDPEEVTLSELLDFIGAAAHGDILFRGAAGWQRLAAGAAGRVLQTNGGGADPTWVVPSGGSGGDVLKARIEVTELEMEALFSSPKELIPAPGADKVIVPISFSMEVNIVANHSATSGVTMTYNGNAQNLLGAVLGFSFNSGLGKKFMLVGIGNAIPVFQYGSGFDVRNKSLVLKTAADLSASGQTTAVVNIAYIIATTT